MAQHKLVSRIIPGCSKERKTVLKIVNNAFAKSNPGWIQGGEIGMGEAGVIDPIRM